MRSLFNATEIIAQRGWDGRFFSHDFWDYLDHLEELENAWMLFFHHEEESMRIFLWRLKYMAMEAFYGFPIPQEMDHTPFPEEKWNTLVQLAATKSRKVPAQDELHFDFLDTWILESYRLPGVCEVVPGDVVLSCGAFTGNTSIYFAEKVGNTGHVYSFEAVRASFEKLKKNTAAYANCTPVQGAVAERPGTVFIAREDTAAHVAQSGVAVEAVSLDRFVAANALDKVDFIKMDIEGSELGALRGARETIQRFRPKMAISVYHKSSDLYELPAAIRAIDPNYNFRLRHFSNRSWETIMFCTPEKVIPGWQGTVEPLSLADSREFLQFMSFVEQKTNEVGEA